MWCLRLIYSRYCNGVLYSPGRALADAAQPNYANTVALTNPTPGRVDSHQHDYLWALFLGQVWLAPGS